MLDGRPAETLQAQFLDPDSVEGHLNSMVELLSFWHSRTRGTRLFDQVEDASETPRLLQDGITPAQLAFLKKTNVWVSERRKSDRF
jgi:hypothetical protein